MILLFALLFFVSKVYSSCNDLCSLNNFSYPKNCFCTQCDTFSDCCEDQQIPVTNPEGSLYSCNSQIKIDKYIYTVAKCNSGYNNKKIIDECENLENKNFINNLPVYSNGIFYRNVYCVQCNIKISNSSDLKIFKVTTQLFYMEDEVTQEVIENILSGKKTDLYDIEIRPPEGVNEPRGCIRYIEKCPSTYTNETVIDLCNSYTAIRYDQDGTSYKNKYCALCNNMTNENCAPIFIRKLYLSSLQLVFDLTDLSNELILNYNITLSNQQKFEYNQSIRLNKMEETSDECNENLIQDMIKKYLTIIGNSLSIISLISLLLYYFKNKVLRNLPGKILISLSIALLLSQASFMLNYFTESYLEKNYKNDGSCDMPYFENKFTVHKLFETIEKILPCFTVGLVTHYFYLSFFLWSNIMAFDLFKMFNKSSRLSASVSENIYVKYSLFSWMTPLVIILIMLFKNYDRLSYGFKQCFISSSLDLLIFFILPVCVILTFNLIYISISIISIKKVDKMSKKYLSGESSSVTSGGKSNTKSIKSNISQNENKNKRLILFVKLFILTGLTWTLGIISSLVNQKYSFLWYIYIGLNSLQGVFIFCSYAFNSNPKSNIKSSFYKTFSNIFTKKSNNSSTTDNSVSRIS